MGTIEIPAKEVVRVASREEGPRWEVSIEEGTVLFDKNPRRIQQDGRKRQAGEKGAVQLSGDETLYAYSNGGGTIRVSRGNFVFDLFTTRVVESEDEQAAKASAIGNSKVEISVNTGATEYGGLFENTTEEVALLRQLTGTNSTGDPSNVNIQYEVVTDDTTKQLEWSVFMEQLPYDPPYPIPIYPEWELNAYVENEAGSNIDVTLEALFRSDVPNTTGVEFVTVW